MFEFQDEVDLEQQAEKLNDQMAQTDGDEDLVQQIQSQLEDVYDDRLDALDVNTAESRALSILFGFGFTTKMQSTKTREFSGVWRMRIALARALFLKTLLRGSLRIDLSTRVALVG